MPHVIRRIGDARSTRTLNGEEVHREDRIFLRSYHQWFPVLNTDTHFIYKSNRVGMSTLCTCGSAATIFNYDAYQRYSSFIGMEVLACHTFIQYGFHADGSH